MTDIDEIIAGDLITPPEPKMAQEVFSAAFETGVGLIVDQVRGKVEDFQKLGLTAATEDDRTRIRGFAYRLARAKTLLDTAGKKVVDDLKALPKIVDANRKAARDTIERWQVEVRKPLTEWEAAEAKRVAEHVQEIDGFRNMADTMVGGTASELTSAIRVIDSRLVTAATFEEFAEEALVAKQAALARLRTALEARERYEITEAENARLRAAQAKQQAELEEANRKVADAERRERETREREERRQREAEETRRRNEQEVRDSEARRAAAAERTKQIEQEAVDDLVKAVKSRTSRPAALAVFRAIREGRVRHVGII